MDFTEPRPYRWTREDYLRLTEFCGPHLPGERVHYLMGVGNPADLLHAIAQGFDMFDCVQPTRMARHGVAFTRDGNLNLNNARFKEDQRPLDPRCACQVCRSHSRASWSSSSWPAGTRRGAGCW